eukprot:CAMPEP_0168616782 /NCGR_PEP_ID=MMETSP0449_2-20121227/5203_1 /TAXON_ID=1082188 /ORGANISM="Strombidium rassoulzadegani, Strain ras09" /LENGTH=47 /DNA_ID= /DNA_START= /DNA_END= /DNA_ORIENTATION=
MLFSEVDNGAMDEVDEQKAEHDFAHEVDEVPLAPIALVDLELEVYGQ